MENNNKYKKIIKILIIMLVLLLLAFGGLYLYRTIKNRGRETKNIPIQHGVVDNNKEESKIVLNEEDVKKWLDKEPGFIAYFTDYLVDYDYETATSKNYTEILMWYLTFGGAVYDSHKDLGYQGVDGYNGIYNVENTISKSKIVDFLNRYFSVGLDKINFSQVKDKYNGFAEVNEDENNYYVKTVITDTMSSSVCELRSITLRDNKIVVLYNEKEFIMGISEEDLKIVGQREIVLKKTDTGYNILKAYKVES